MAAYWISRCKVDDPVEYKKYTDLVPGIIARFGGKVLARGGRYQINEGPDHFPRHVVIEFPTFEQANAAWTAGATSTTHLCNGMDPFHHRTPGLVGAALASDIPCVLDADALNLVAESTDLRHACARRRAASARKIATP